MARILQPYKVIVSVTREEAYIVDAISTEEAEVIVEGYLEDNEEPRERSITDTVFLETFPIKEDE